MIRLLTVFDGHNLLANAGSSVAERALLRALVESGEVAVRAAVAGASGAVDRVADHFRDLVRRGALELVPLLDTDRPALLEGMDGAMVHGAFDLVVRHDLYNALPLAIHVHSLELTGRCRATLGACFARWHGTLPLTMIVPSDSTHRRLLSLHRSPKRRPHIAVVPHGVGADELRGGDRLQGRRLLRIAEQATVVLSLNRISPQKGDYYQLLHAFSGLRERSAKRDQLVLCLVGGVADHDRPYVASLGAWAKRLGIDEQLRVVPHLPEGMKKHVLAAADTCVSLATNPQESFGLVLLEAMTCGLPVVATDWNGYREVVHPAYARWQVPTISSHDAARALEWANDLAVLSLATACELDAVVEALADSLQPSESARLACDAAAVYAAGSSWELSAARVVSIWKAMLGGAMPPPTSVPSNLKPLESTVDGLATHYLTAGSRLRTTARSSPHAHAAAALYPGAGKSRHVDDACHICAGGPTSLAQIRERMQVEVATADAVVLSLIRAGLLELVKDPPAQRGSRS